MLQGKKTLIVNCLILLCAVFGWQLAPETIDQYADAILVLSVPAIAGINILLRFVTKGPVNLKIGKPDNTASALLIAMLLTGGLGACASTVETQSAQQKIFAIQSDFQVAQQLILSYVERPDAQPEIKANLQQLEQVAYESIQAAQLAARQGEDWLMPTLLRGTIAAVNEIFAYLAANNLLPRPPPRASLVAQLSLVQAIEA